MKRTYVIDIEAGHIRPQMHQVKTFIMMIAMILCGCTSNNDEIKAQTMNQKMYITIDGGMTITVRLAENSSADALVAALKEGDITYEAHDYGGFEKVGALGRSFPQNNTQIDTKAGDVILYQGSNLCLYYDENSWSFTRIGWIEGLTQAELKQALKAGEGNVSVRLSLSSGTTAIKGLNGNHMEEGVYYSLNGQRVKNPSKGIYIKNGKKILL